MCDEYFIETINEILKRNLIIPPNISVTEYAAMIDYSLYSDDLNIYLRGNDQNNDEYECKRKLLNNAISKLPKYFHRNHSIYRGVQLPKELYANICETRSYLEEGFYSSSLILEKAEHFMFMDMNPEDEWIIGVFEIPESNIGINLSSYTGEHILDGTEILLPSNIKFEILTIRNDMHIFKDGVKREMFRIKMLPMKIVE